MRIFSVLNKPLSVIEKNLHILNLIKNWLRGTLDWVVSLVADISLGISYPCPFRLVGVLIHLSYLLAVGIDDGRLSAAQLNAARRAL